jgi:hypothetical protein
MKKVEGKVDKNAIGRCPSIERRLHFGAAELLILNQYFKKGNDNNCRRGFK